MGAPIFKITLATSAAQSKKVRLWASTWNNSTLLEELGYRHTVESSEKVTWSFHQIERGESGTRHIQGVVYLRNPTSMVGLTKLFGTEKIHWEPCRESAAVNKKYCSKEECRVEGPWESGTMPEQGKRGDLSTLLALARTGASDVQLWESNPSSMARYYRAVEKCREVFRPRRRWTTTNIVLWCGRTGTGKTRKAWWLAEQHCPGVEPCDVLPFESKARTWLDGYSNHKVVIMDDMTVDGMSLGLFLRLTDRYPCRVQVKGAVVNWAPELIIWTSNKHPREWFPQLKSEQALGPVIRRLTENGSRIERMQAVWQPPSSGTPGPSSPTSMAEHLEAAMFPDGVPFEMPEPATETYNAIDEEAFPYHGMNE